jgi:hypothetical protein
MFKVGRKSIKLTAIKWLISLLKKKCQIGCSALISVGDRRKKKILVRPMCYLHLYHYGYPVVFIMPVLQWLMTRAAQFIFASLLSVPPAW